MGISDSGFLVSEAVGTVPIKEIDRPLGLDRPPVGVETQSSLPSRKTALLAFAVLGVVGASALFALRPSGLTSPEPVVVAEVKPDTAPAPQAAPGGEIEVTRQDTGPGGPAIIKVEPPADVTMAKFTIEDPSAPKMDARTAHMPIRAMLEDSSAGPLPKRDANGRRPFDAYARPWSGARGARVAIVIGGLAVSQTGTQSAIEKLPPEVTLAFASQGNSISRWMQNARQRGHEILIQIPMEPFDYPTVNPGKATLTVESAPDENLNNLRWSLSRTTNYVGVMNYMGARFVSDREALAPVMDELGKRGLLFLDDGTTARSGAPDQALKSGVPLATGDTIIDAVRDRGEILKKLDQLEATARAKGFAVGTGSAFDQTVDAVASWANEAKKRGIEVVPISAIAVDPERKY